MGHSVIESSANDCTRQGAICAAGDRGEIRPSIESVPGIKANAFGDNGYLCCADWDDICN